MKFTTRCFNHFSAKVTINELPSIDMPMALNGTAHAVPMQTAPSQLVRSNLSCPEVRLNAEVADMGWFENIAPL
jgi:hypothetical protein